MSEQQEAINHQIPTLPLATDGGDSSNLVETSKLPEQGVLPQQQLEESLPPPTAATTSKKRKKKDPKAPRRPLSAYNIFFKSVREELQASSTAERPSFSGLVQLVTSRWKVIQPEEKVKFEVLAKEDYQRYAEEMKVYRQRPEVQTVLVDPHQGKRRCKFIGVSKRPLSGYNIFFREEHARLKNSKVELEGEVGEVDNSDNSCMTVIIAKKWSELTDTQKQELNKRAAEVQRQAEEQEVAREAARKAASMKNGQMISNASNTNSALLAQYQDYYAARMQQQINHMPTDSNFPGIMMQGNTMMSDGSLMSKDQVGADNTQANWDAMMVKQQQEQHFQQQYMQWCFEQLQQQQQLGQWQQYQQPNQQDQVQQMSLQHIEQPQQDQNQQQQQQQHDYGEQVQQHQHQHQLQQQQQQQHQQHQHQQEHQHQQMQQQQLLQQQQHIQQQLMQQQQMQQHQHLDMNSLNDQDLGSQDYLNADHPDHDAYKL